MRVICNVDVFRLVSLFKRISLLPFPNPLSPILPPPPPLSPATALLGVRSTTEKQQLMAATSRSKGVPDLTPDAARRHSAAPGPPPLPANGEEKE